MRTILLLIAVATPVWAANTTPPAAQTVSIAGTLTPAAIAKDIKEQTGNEIDVSNVDSKPIAVKFEKLEFWNAVDQVAQRSGSRIVVSGGRIVLKQGKSHSPSFVRGAFLFTVRGIDIHGDAESGRAGYIVILDVAWEPWLNAYRIDTVPKIESATDDRGKSITASVGGSRTFTSGNTAELSIRLQGVTRASKTLAIAGSVMITIADKLLTFTFDADSGKAISDQPQEGVSVSLAKHGVEGKDWIAVAKLRYPKSDVVWESYEYAVYRNNTMRLLPPRGQPIAADRVEAAELRYEFKGRGKQVGPGWKLDYRTPGPMREIIVPFTLKDIRLP